MVRQTAIPSKYDCFQFTAPPRDETRPADDDGRKYGGIKLVAQYLEAYYYRVRKYAYVAEGTIRAAFEKAYQLDMQLEGKQLIQMASPSCPTLESCIRAFIENSYVTFTSNIGFVRNTPDDIKYFTRQYGGIIVECRLTDRVYQQGNVLPWDLFGSSSDIGNVLSDDFTKGFITCGYDSSYLYVQNNLGVRTGSCGFHKIPWTVVPNLVLKGACFKLQKDIYKPEQG